jgi:hypothetical protein
MPDSPNLVVGVIDKNGGSEIHVSLSEYRGQRLIDVRTFASFTAANVPMATKKGIALRIELIGELRQALAEAEAMARKLGWIDEGDTALRRAANG